MKNGKKQVLTKKSPTSGKTGRTASEKLVDSGNYVHRTETPLFMHTYIAPKLNIMNITGIMYFLLESMTYKSRCTSAVKNGVNSGDHFYPRGIYDPPLIKNVRNYLNIKALWDFIAKTPSAEAFCEAIK